MLSGCSDLNMENFRKHKLQPEMFFDFNTTSRINVDLDYGEYGAYTLVSIYSENPLATEADAVKDGTAIRPVLKLFTDGQGKVVSSFDMPESLGSTVFLQTSSMGVPQLVEAEVVDSTITYKYERPEYSKEDFRTRVASYLYYGMDLGNLHCILNCWGQYHGKVGDHNLLIQDECDLPAKALPRITKAFWNGSSTRPVIVNNSTDISGKDINMVTLTDGMEVYFTFITENSSSMNSIGYYYYPVGEEPENFDDIEKFIIFPNASVEGNAPYGSGMSFSSADAPISQMTTVQLLYSDHSTGGYVLTPYFPKDLEIGFFIIKDGWTPDYSGEVHASNSDFRYTNRSANDGRVNFIRKDTEYCAVYGAEYGGDNSYDDIIFTVQSSPEGSLDFAFNVIPNTDIYPDSYDYEDDWQDDEPDEPKPDDDDFIYYTKNEIFRTYCFEDLWPVRGDYDMNDVVIDHRIRVYTDYSNKVLRVYDDFTVCNRYKSAQVVDAFAVIIPESQRGTMILPDGAIEEDETGAVILFDDIQEHLDETVTIKRVLNSSSLTINDIITDYDPFIIPLIDNDNILRDDRREVHMPKKNGTKKLDYRLLGMAQEAYFVDKDGEHPFALTIPVSVKNGEYTITSEMIEIDSEYDRYSNWVHTRGKEDKDWYTTYR